MIECLDRFISDIIDHTGMEDPSQIAPKDKEQVLKSIPEYAFCCPPATAEPLE
jgi:hypothetical protein